MGTFGVMFLKPPNKMFKYFSFDENRAIEIKRTDGTYPRQWTHSAMPLNAVALTVTFGEAK